MIPVDVLTGFLGSGKTTLLSRLLREPSLARTAVIVNEFGEIGLDHDLIETSDEQSITLLTGCLCCRVQNDLADTLRNLQARNGNSGKYFDRVVIETSGLADPAPILHTLMADGALASEFAIGRVLTTVDAVTGVSTLARYPEARKQVMLADQLLLTKTDLADPPASLFDALADLNHDAPVNRVQHELDAELIFSAEKTSAGGPEFKAAGTGHSHTVGLCTVTIVRQNLLPASVVPLFLEGLMANAGDRLLRIKGLIGICESPETPMVIHSVQHILHRPVWLEAWPSATRYSRIVLIGTGIPLRWPDLLLDALLLEGSSVKQAIR